MNHTSALSTLPPVNVSMMQRQERDVRRLERVAPGVELADELAVLVEERALVLPDGELRLHRDRLIGPLVDDQILGLVGPRDEHLLRALLYEIEDAHRDPSVLSLALW